MPRLMGKVAIVTGGAGGIGLATGRLFAREGANVLLVDLREEVLRNALQHIQGDKASYTVADVTKPAHVKRYIRTAVKRYGGVDILVSNAGIQGVVRRITDYPTETFDKVIAVNVRGTWLGLKYVIPELRRRGGGSIIITSSFAGVKGTLGVSAYVASKHAVVGLMRAAALECATQGIRVNAVNPGPIDTRMMRSLERGIEPHDMEKARLLISKSIPMKRYGTPDEVAHLIVFLASEESRYCTGSVYMVDGGTSAR
jgi:NAD(P)-dependent dehydrogenase (short-subunit alcohol dehydrogenase family)